MKKVLPLVKTKIGLASLAVLIAIALGATVTTVKVTTHQISVAQAKQKAELKDEFFNLIIRGNSKIRSLEAAVKSVAYNEDFKEPIIRTSGTTGYQTNVTNSRQDVQKKTEEVKQAQQALLQFLADHKDFVLSLSPEVREQAAPIVMLNIPAKIREWESEQRHQDREWKCSGFSTDPICF